MGEVKHYDGRTTFFVLLTCVLAASGGLMFGYDVGISGTYILDPGFANLKHGLDISPLNHHVRTQPCKKSR